MTLFGLATLAVAVVGLTARYLPVIHHAILLAAALSPYLMIGAPIATLVFLLQRHWRMTTVAVATTIAAIAVELPIFVGETGEHSGVQIRVMTANLYLGQADPKVVVKTAEASADVLALQELTPTAVQQLSAAGLDRTFPYRLLDARAEASGTGVWSRYPLKEPKSLKGYWHAMLTARVAVDGVPIEPVLFVAHVSGPWPMPLTDWNRDYTRLPGALADLAATAGKGCVIVAGDFNSTFDLRPFRNLVRDGYRDAAEESGAGITATYPANGLAPPLLAIDHVLIHQCTATSVHTVTVPGSDHRGLSSVIEIPPTT
jgi:endonuclease/exonuclease/phosphatase (EEP) superfamily protein YafD